MSNTLTIRDNMVVSLEYVLRLEDGEEVERTDGEPLQFIQGAGETFPKLEEALAGKTIGTKMEVKLLPEDAFGDYDEEDFDVLPLEDFPDDVELVEGMFLELEDSETGTFLEAIVAEVREDEVVIDFNHPLAGETLYFTLEVVGIRPATAEELDHGHVHDLTDLNGHAH
jgi:FKBP-type peptidyl-prolyl cis-trans isomerase SlyD